MATKAETAMSAAKRAAAAISLVVSRDNRQPLEGRRGDNVAAPGAVVKPLRGPLSLYDCSVTSPEWKLRTRRWGSSTRSAPRSSMPAAAPTTGPCRVSTLMVRASR